MNIVELDQRSDNWHRWRTNGVGASDICVLMGSSPYKSPYQLWEEKRG